VNMFKKILIANRGEIAIRIMRACKELGIKTIAVYSDADKNALHVQHADEAIHIGDSSPKEYYLNADKLIRAALDSKADAIHPGYGFLSENASFALKVASVKLTFIGPSADSIRAMGDKAESKIAMKKAGVPTVPGFEGLDSEKDLKKAAREIGYPVLVKAAAGGGGKGMRVVNDESELSESIESARREALNAFGDERLLIEKYIPNAHHIEFQVFGDQPVLILADQALPALFESSLDGVQHQVCQCLPVIAVQLGLVHRHIFLEPALDCANQAGNGLVE